MCANFCLGGFEKAFGTREICARLEKTFGIREILLTVEMYTQRESCVLSLLFVDPGVETSMAATRDVMNRDATRDARTRDVSFLNRRF